MDIIASIVIFLCLCAYNFYVEMTGPDKDFIRAGEKCFHHAGYLVLIDFYFIVRDLV